LNFSVEDCRINIRKGLDFVALCGLGNTLVFSKIDPAVAADPQVLREAADAITKGILSQSERRQKSSCRGSARAAKARVLRQNFLIKEVSRSESSSAHRGFKRCSLIRRTAAVVGRSVLAEH
jgi:hypothetical protein